MTKKILKSGLIVILILIAPLICIEVLTKLTTNYQFSAIQVFQVKSKMALASIVITINLISAIITALVTAFPSGYLAGKQARIIAAIMVILIESFPVAAFFQMASFDAFTTSLLIAQFLTVLLSTFMFAEMGGRLAAKRQDKADV